MKKIYLIISTLAVLSAVSCQKDFMPSNQMPPERLTVGDITAGNYSMFKDNLDYKGDGGYTANTYVRHYTQMAEFRGDNICLSNRTEDPLYQAVCWNDDGSLGNNSYMWYVAYKIIYGANTVIEKVDPETEDAEERHMLGENYFMRALCHLHLSNLFSMPYSHGTENPGVVLRLSTETTVTERATVGQVYDRIVLDLLEAIKFMDGPRRGNNQGYISKEAAQGLLSRVYLHMGRDNDVVTLVGEMLGGADPSAKLDPNVDTYFPRSLTSSETLWCVAHIAGTSDNMGQSSIGSMYYGVGGWGEIYWSDPLMDLMERYPSDKRYAYMVGGTPTDGVKMVRWDSFDAAESPSAITITATASGDAETGYTFTYDGSTINVEEEIVNTYPRYYAMIDGVKTHVRISDKVGLGMSIYPMYFMTKFSNQDGLAMLSSPVMVRWGEVILNRAEAYAKLNNATGALADVNAIRTRAGIEAEGMFTEGNMTERGYASLLDVVLDERRLELCFEGFRALDMIRNKKELDRRYPGVQNYELIDYNNPKFAFRIPNDETGVSEIAQNQ